MMVRKGRAPEVYHLRSRAANERNDRNDQLCSLVFLVTVVAHREADMLSSGNGGTLQPTRSLPDTAHSINRLAGWLFR